MTLVLLGFALPLAVAGPAVAQAGMTASTATATSPVRILIVGDSITQGRGKASPSGGYSWGYFLWKRFASGAADLVGNRTGPS